MTQIDWLIAAWKCSESKLPGERCEFCPYGYGYLDDSGDYEFWWCDDEKMMKDAIKLLQGIKEVIKWQ